MSLAHELEEAITEVMHRHNAHPVGFLGLLRFYSNESESFNWMIFEPEGASMFDTAGNAAFLSAWVDSNLYDAMENTCD